MPEIFLSDFFVAETDAFCESGNDTTVVINYKHIRRYTDLRIYKYLEGKKEKQKTERLTDLSLIHI